MSIEVALLLSAISVAFAIYQGLVNMKRNHTVDAKNEATQLAIVITKLDNIDSGVAEIKSEMRSLKADVKDDHDRLIKVEQIAKAAHERLDEYKKSNSLVGDDA